MYFYRPLFSLLLVLCGVCAGSAWADEPLAAQALATAAQKTQPELLRVVDLDVGEAAEITLANGKTVRVKVLELKETRDSLRDAVRRAEVTAEVNGQQVQLVSATYHLPTTIAGVRIDCPITQGYYSNSGQDSWGLKKAVRLRLWPEGSPLIEPEEFGYPLKQRWFATATQMANEPTYVDGVEKPSLKKIYYHSGEDIGGAEGLAEVVAATDGLIVSSGLNVLEEHRRSKEFNSPVVERYDVVYLLDKRGWYYRYSHLQSIEKAILPGRTVRKGDRLGVLGKEGASGGWSHLHFEIKSLQPSGLWGTQAAYGMLWEAYLRQHEPQLIAVARPHHVLWAGEKVTLDATRSWSAAGPIRSYEWTFTDGSKSEQPRFERTYSQPGQYSEILKITDAQGRTDYDFAIVQVLDKEHPDKVPQGLHAAYAPTFNLHPGTEISFLCRSFGPFVGSETWDFGDGSPAVQVKSDGNAKSLAKDGYAKTMHRYAQPGTYLASVRSTNDRGEVAHARLCIHIEAAPKPAGKSAALKAASKPFSPLDYLTIQPGSAPIIVSAPHGGALDLPETPLRQGVGLERKPGAFVTARDTGTEELAPLVRAAIARRLGAEPTLVASRVHRKYLDPNRPLEQGSEHPRSLAVHEAYHAALAEACNRAREKHGGGLLIDLHGQGSRRDTVFRGTQNGATVKLLRQRFGEPAHQGRASLLGMLANLGWTVHPSPLSGPEQPGFTGGHIVRTYGGDGAFGFDAIQLEFGGDYRAAVNRQRVANELADAVADYAAAYLKWKPLPTPPQPPREAEELLPAVAAEYASRPEVAVYRGPGASASREKLVQVLAESQQFRLRDITPEEIIAGKLKGAKLLIHPGGSGGGQGKALGEAGREQVRNFVKQGGGFVGVCAGAYLATCDYDWSLHILDAKVVDRQHWARGFGDVEIGFSSAGQELFPSVRQRGTIYYHQGPLLAPAANPQIDDYIPLAAFETEIAKNGAPQGVMRGCTAIARGNFGVGRVLCFSPHPERTTGQHAVLVAGVKWALGGETGPQVPPKSAQRD